jgi:hypothetical protein
MSFAFFDQSWTSVSLNSSAGGSRGDVSIFTKQDNKVGAHQLLFALNAYDYRYLGTAGDECRRVVMHAPHKGTFN